MSAGEARQTGAQKRSLQRNVNEHFKRAFNEASASAVAIKVNGNRKTVHNPDGKVTTYNYDALNRVSDVVNAQGVTNYRYDRSSLKTQVTYPNGTQARWTYDNAGRITTIENRQNTAIVSSYEYAYDSNGNRTQQIETNGAGAETTNYSFDVSDRLTEVQYPNETTTYTYDAAYNRTQELTTEGTTAMDGGSAENGGNDSLPENTEDKTYVYNSRNQVTNITDSVSGDQTEYAYDDNGNRISKTATPTSGGAVTTEFIYDVRDQLRTIQQGGSTIGAFLYDYQGLRIRKQAASETTRYVYDDQSVLIQTDDLGNTLAKYDYGPDKLLSLSHATQGVQFYLFDSLGSIVNLTRPDGAIQARYQYDAWGNIRNEVGDSANVFGFTGHEVDQESGLVYMKARFYDPELGQFLSQDAFEGIVETPPSLHKYLYAYVNPLVYFDPDGNQVFKYVDENGVTVFTDRPPTLPKEELQDRARERNERLKQEPTIDPFELDRQQREKARQRGLLVVEGDSEPDTDVMDMEVTPSQRVAARARLIAEGASDVADVVDEFAMAQTDPVNVIGTALGIGALKQFGPFLKRKAGETLDAFKKRVNKFFDKKADDAADEGMEVADNVFHATTSPQAVEGVLGGIDPKFLNPDSWFGPAFYVARNPDTAIAELVHHGAKPTHGIRFVVDSRKLKVLDLTNPNTAAKWQYRGGPISSATQDIGERAKEEGFNAIKYQSLRGSGENFAILKDFDEVLKPVGVSPAQ